MTVTQIVSTNDTTPDLNASTDEDATCYYKNKTSNYAIMDHTGGLVHWHTLDELSAGDHIYRIQCNDSFGNAAYKDIPFTIVPAESENNYVNDSLNLVTNESNLISVSPTLSIDIAVDENMTNATLSVAEYSDSPVGEQTGFAIEELGAYITITADDDIEDHLTWAMIYVYYTHQQINERRLVEKSLRMYYFDGERWVNVEESGVDTVNNYVWANVTHFSAYGVGGNNAPTGGGKSRSIRPSLYVDVQTQAYTGERIPAVVRLEHSNGAVIYDADVTVQYGVRTVFSGETDPQGKIVFIPGEEGIYVVTAQKEGYVLGWKEMNVWAYDNTTSSTSTTTSSTTTSTTSTTTTTSTTASTTTTTSATTTSIKPPAQKAANIIGAATSQEPQDGLFTILWKWIIAWLTSWM